MVWGLPVAVFVPEVSTPFQEGVLYLLWEGVLYLRAQEGVSYLQVQEGVLYFLQEGVLDLRAQGSA